MMAGPVFVFRSLKKMRKVFYLILTSIAFGILIVPGKGSETWQKISGFLDDLKSKTKDTIYDLIGSVRNMAEEGKAGTKNQRRNGSS
jgi:hypothetical protein